jgi:hypothetical protein
MLLSLNRRFIFVANLKTASTAIEACLRPFSEICIARTEFGKHASFGEIEERYSWAFDLIKRENFVVFGIIRDPLDYVLSIYNFHQKPDFLGQQTFTGDKSFTEFYETWKKRDSWQLRPQYKRFLDRNGGFALDYLFDFDQLGEEWPQICKILGVPDKELRSLNVSPIGARRSDIEPALVEQIYSDYATDSQLVKQFTGPSSSRENLILPK